ncbi:uncharacterized protein [Paramisgurnus dabryanus]|uniref:uncharacterized protein n=1 Tax=Paramisgurnus dabryanus TaxID=90735 RepID=UPI0031F3A30A
MERVRSSLITLLFFTGVLFCEHQKVFGKEVKIRVKPGDNVTLYCDCVIPLGSHIFWIRNSSYGNQSSLLLSAEELFNENIPRFNYVANSTSNSYDLHIKNISVDDEGIYYCAKAERNLATVHGMLEYQYGNRRTHLSLLDPVPSEPPVPNVSELHFNCWTLLFSLCSVCVLLSLILSATCVYCLCHRQTTGYQLNAGVLKANIFKMDSTEKHQCVICKTGKICVHTEVSYSLLT